MTTHSHYRLSSDLITYVALECAGIELVVVSTGGGCTSAIMQRLSGHTYDKQITAVYAESDRDSASSEAHSSDIDRLHRRGMQIATFRTGKQTLFTQ